MLKSRLFICFVLLNLFLSLPAFSQTDADDGVPQKPKPVTVLSIMEKSGLFEIFLKAINDGGYHDKLAKEGPFTILAPVDAAFSRIGNLSYDKLFSNKNILKKFLDQHIIAGKYTLTDLKNMNNLTTAGGVSLPIEHKEPIAVARANVEGYDIEAPNGVVVVLMNAYLQE